MFKCTNVCHLINEGRISIKRKHYINWKIPLVIVYRNKVNFFLFFLLLLLLLLLLINRIDFILAFVVNKANGFKNRIHIQSSSDNMNSIMLYMVYDRNAHAFHHYHHLFLYFCWIHRKDDDKAKIARCKHHTGIHTGMNS